MYVTKDCTEYLYESSPAALNLREAFPQCVFRFVLREDICKADLTWAEVIAGHPAPEQLKDCTHLKWLHIQTAGVEAYAKRSLYASEAIIVTRAAGVYDIPVAEHTLALLMALIRRIPQMVKEGSSAWEKRIHPRRELTDAHVLIIGAGRIGKKIAACLSGFTANIRGINLSGTASGPEFCEVSDLTQLHFQLAWADYVIDILPLTPATWHIINEEAFAHMKEGACFVNVGRGGTVDHLALVTALREGHLYGAALDVAEDEPMHTDDELYKCENVLITPHVAGFSQGVEERQLQCFRGLLERYLRNEKMPCRVDMDKGY